jgi:hypothetical protein
VFHSDKVPDEVKENLMQYCWRTGRMEREVIQKWVIVLSSCHPKSKGLEVALQSTGHRCHGPPGPCLASATPPAQGQVPELIHRACLTPLGCWREAATVTATAGLTERLKALWETLPEADGEEERGQLHPSSCFLTSCQCLTLAACSRKPTGKGA